MGNPRYANGSARRGVQARMRAEALPCWVCGMPIDYGAPKGDPMSFQVDELVPVSKGGSPIDRANLAPAHACCNNWRKAKSVATVQTVKRCIIERFGGWRSPLEFVQKAKALKRAPRARARKARANSRLTW